MKRSLLIIAILFFLILILILISTPRVVFQDTISFEHISDYPDLCNSYDSLCATNTNVFPSDSILVATAKSMWGSCTYYLLPCYTLEISDVPENGNAHWNTSLFILSDCSDKNSITAKLCRFTVQDVCVDVDVENHTFISTLVEVEPGNIKFDTWDKNSLSLQQSFSLSHTPTLSVSFIVSTSGAAVNENTPAIGSFLWKYSIFCNNQQITTNQNFLLEHRYIVNAQ